MVFHIQRLSRPLLLTCASFLLVVGVLGCVKPQPDLVLIPVRYEKDYAVGMQDLRPYVDSNAFLVEAWMLRLTSNSTVGFMQDVARVTRGKLEYRPMQQELIGPINDTLARGWGDCRDYSLISASMLEAVEPAWNVSLFAVDLDHAFKPDFPNHWMLWLETDEGTFLLDPSRGLVVQDEQWVGWKLPI